MILWRRICSGNNKCCKKEEKKNVLVVYFSETGTTKDAAVKVKKATGGKIYRIILFDKNC